MLDWNDLRYALEVARTGSLSAAARSLGVHQSTVGRRIDGLETALGVRLFVRTSGGVSATSDGASVLASIEGLGSALTRFERAPKSSASSVRGLVRLGITETGARQLVEGILPELLARHPHLCIEIVPSNRAVDLSRGEADLAVRLLAPDTDLIARRIGHVMYGLYASETYLSRHQSPIKNGLEGHDILMPSRELATGPEAAWLVEHAALASRRLHACSLVTLAQAAAAGLGICVLPCNLARLHHGVQLIRLLPEIPNRQVWLVMLPEMRNMPHIRAVASAVTEEIRKRLA
jgi:DNA-binding transcriptional LysR family regulator